jgi:replicative DNA helicase
MSGAPDEAELHKAGKLPNDPRAGTKPVAMQVPRVHTVRELLTGSAVRSMSKEQHTTCMTGHHRLDDITGGIRRGFTWLFGADTSFGKSSWLISVADENIKVGKRVLICSSEDVADVYADRLLARRANISAKNLRDRTLLPYEVSRVTETVNKAEDVPVYIDARRWAVEDLAPHLRTIIKEEKIDIVAFDYVQEFQSKKRWQDERVKYREIASQLRHIAKDANISAILFSQLTMGADTKIPNRSNIRECKDIANASEVIVIGFEPDKEIPTATGPAIEAGTKCLFVDKCKNGPRGIKFPMFWNDISASFSAVRSNEHYFELKNELNSDRERLTEEMRLAREREEARKRRASAAE